MTLLLRPSFSFFAFLPPFLGFLAASGCTGSDSSTEQPAQNAAAASRWDNDAFVTAPVSNKLGFSGPDLQTSGLGSVDGYATVDSANGTLVWRKPTLTGEFFVACAPTRLPGLDSSMLPETFPSGVLGATLTMALSLDAAALANPDTPVMSARPGYYSYGDLGELVWMPEDMSQDWSARDIQSGRLADYAFDRGVAYRKKRGITEPNCGAESCALQELPEAAFADDKTCVQITFFARADGSSPVTDASLKHVVVESQSYGYKPNFPRTVSVSFACSSTECAMPPTVIAQGERSSDDEFTYLFRPHSRTVVDLNGGPVGSSRGLSHIRAYYSLDGGRTRTMLDLDEAEPYWRALYRTGTSGLVVGAENRSVEYGSPGFVFEIQSIEPTLTTLILWKRDADNLIISLDSEVSSYRDIYELASMLELELRQARVTLGGIETLLIYSANRPEAKRQDLYYTDGDDAGKPRRNADMPAWFFAASRDPNNLTFRRLASIRAQIIAGQTVTATDKGDAMATAEDAKARRRKSLEETLNRADRLLQAMVRWSHWLKVEQQQVRDHLLLKARAGHRSMLNGLDDDLQPRF